MTHRFEAHVEAVGQPFDVVARGLCAVQERAVRHHQRAGEIVRQANPRERDALGVRETGIGNARVQQRRAFQQCQLRSHLERLLARPQVRRQPQHARLRI